MPLRMQSTEALIVDFVRVMRTRKRRAAIYRILRSFGFTIKRAQKLRDWREGRITRHLKSCVRQIRLTADDGV